MRKIKLPKSPYLPNSCKILDFHRETPDNFTLKTNMRVLHHPGQFVQVSIPGIGEAPISICSYSNKFIELNIREVGNVTKSLSRLRKGNRIFIRGPYGNGYPINSLKGSNIVIIGGGCGIAPLKSLIEYMKIHRKEINDVFLFLGYKNPDDIIFRSKIKKWKKLFNLKLTIDKNPSRQFCYGAKEELIVDALNELDLSAKDKLAFVCGPPVMIKHAIDILKQKGFEDSQIFISAERLMYCAMGICCHCMIHEKFTCTDGPVFRYDEIRDFKND